MHLLYHHSRDAVFWTSFNTPLGVSHIAATRKGICRLSIPRETKEHFFVWLYAQFDQSFVKPHPGPCQEAIEQVDAYLAGTLTQFEIRLDLRGTLFQLRTWEKIQQIRYGTTITYRDLAAKLDLPKGYQAVGAAVGQNPVPIMVPCHRVVGSDGSLTGYMAGPTTKQWLLRHEGALLL